MTANRTFPSPLARRFADAILIRLAFFCAAALAADPQQPAANVTFSVTPAGNAPFTYQWQFQPGANASANDAAAAVRQADQWRADHRIIDMHEHLDYTPALLARAVRVLDASGVGLGIDLTPGTVTRGPNGEPGEFERNKKMEDTLFPGRWVQYMNLDYKNWDQPDFARQAVKQVEEGRRLGAAGYKEWKRFGLYLRDGSGALIKIDDPKLDPMWERLGQLHMPVTIHVADPKAFFEPYTPANERWAELKDHKSWWFGDTNKFPPFKSLLEALSRVIGRHPGTTFVCAHFGNNAEELEWVGAQLDEHPNMVVDLAARIPEIGRHDPQMVHDFFVKYQDRIVFATDFQSLERLMILGSSGPEEPPSEADADVFFLKEFRWLETWDKNWPHMTPIQGNWNISSIGLPVSVLRKIYFDNARRFLARSLPAPVLRARRTTRDFEPDADFSKTIWQTARPVYMDAESSDGTIRADLSTEVRCMWSSNYLYLAYRCPFTELTVFDPPQHDHKRVGQADDGGSLWDRDVVEAFIGSDHSDINHYTEFEVAPSNERLDLSLRLPSRDFAWESHFQTAVKVDSNAKVWDCEVRIPMEALSAVRPAAGTKWRINLYRSDRASKAGLAWNPCLTPTFHTPERFGVLEFAE
ncbi:MAG TPA: amidohydrolase family protein [Verrucomicrobiae bacterium]|jgi:predicted TIM-barrel fold metal-dependent hydrolase